MSAPATPDSPLSGCLRQIAALLEKGEAVEAAKVVEALNTVVARGPVPMLESEIAEARALLVRCATLEEGLRGNALSALQRLGAVRRSRVYRLGGTGP